MSYRDLTTITSPVAVSGIRATPVVPLEPTAMLYEQDFIVARASYAAAAFSDTNATYTSAYFVGDANFRDMGDSVWQFTRQWATVPASFSEYETVAFTYPAFAGVYTGTPADITAISNSSGQASLTTTATGITTGDVVHISVQYTYSGATYAQSLWAIVTSTATNTVRVGASLFPFLGSSGSGTSVTGRIVEGAVGRTNPKTLTVTSRVAREYLYTTTPSSSLPALQAFRPITSAGDDATVLSSSTLPSVSTYQSYFVSGAELVAECRVNRWRGNIYERTTRFVPAL